jgi:hypothetical protein
VRLTRVDSAHAPIVISASVTHRIALDRIATPRLRHLTVWVLGMVVWICVLDNL